MIDTLTFIRKTSPTSICRGGWVINEIPAGRFVSSVASVWALPVSGLDTTEVAPPKFMPRSVGASPLTYIERKETCIWLVGT